MALLRVLHAAALSQETGTTVLPVIALNICDRVRKGVQYDAYSCIL
jgi:hypothetical protein